MMKRKDIRSYVFFFMMFAFVCVLLTGGSRLLGGEAEAEQAEMPVSVRLVQAALCAPSSSQAQSSLSAVRTYTPDRQTAVPMEAYSQMERLVLSDANGNVIGHRSYMHEVYQVFALGDGFV